MKKFMIMAAFVLSSVGAFAQQRAGTTTFQPKIGLNVSTVADGDWKAGLAVGGELQHQINRDVAIAGGLVYSTQGTKFDHYTWNPGYLNIPITLNYYVTKGLAIKAGVQPGFMISKDDAENVNTFDFAVPVGLSYEYQNFVFDARYNIGTTKVVKHADEGYTNVIQLTIGYKFAL